MTLRRYATKPLGMAGTSALACISSTSKPWAVGINRSTLAHFTANDVTEWSMGPMGGSTG